MENRKELSQQCGLLSSWLEAAPFQEYRGWHIRAFEEGGGWTWDIVEPDAKGGGWFESAQVYPSRSKALLEARKLILRSTVCWEVTQVLQELYEERRLELAEYLALLNSLQDNRPMTLPN